MTANLQLGNSDLSIFPLVLGGNVFGFSADRDTSFRVLDAYAAGGGNLIDTADSYSAWAPGNVGGESETIIGEWLADRRPEGVHVATKVAQHPDFSGLAPDNVRRAAEASLQRLQLDTIDLYYAHKDDPEVELAEVVSTFDALVKEGKVRTIGLSNFTPERTLEWLRIAEETGAAKPVALQPHYNLVHRNEVEEQLIPVAAEQGLSLLPYFGLAAGFLTGKYRSTEDTGGGSKRAGGAAKYATEQGLAIIDALESIGNDHGASIASTALAWLRQQPTVLGPIASASKQEQVADLLASAKLELSDDEIAQLNAVSEWTPTN
ncbi:aldo/keto reductase [Parenemella sanctibonifatiensis]|uniref:Alcohol dehydrogenase n=1 Tax=Parenemella sanctibonifatiensis TaxID=2016505 RepID=A0A255ELP4_9ACTN|nr:aldo/keto reductase [Parenemella sanctibonifatiensis]OYN92426.1 alcohol dehydrogenase [Parenemella sanctibonifatiensis]